MIHRTASKVVGAKNIEDHAAAQDTDRGPHLMDDERNETPSRAWRAAKSVKPSAAKSWLDQEV